MTGRLPFGPGQILCGCRGCLRMAEVADRKDEGSLAADLRYGASPDLRKAAVQRGGGEAAPGIEPGTARAVSGRLDRSRAHRECPAGPDSPCLVSARPRGFRNPCTRVDGPQTPIGRREASRQPFGMPFVLAQRRPKEMGRGPRAAARGRGWRRQVLRQRVRSSGRRRCCCSCRRRRDPSLHDTSARPSPGALPRTSCPGERGVGPCRPQTTVAWMLLHADFQPPNACPLDPTFSTVQRKRCRGRGSTPESFEVSLASACHPGGPRTKPRRMRHHSADGTVSTGRARAT